MINLNLNKIRPSSTLAKYQGGQPHYQCQYQVTEYMYISFAYYILALFIPQETRIVC